MSLVAGIITFVVALAFSWSILRPFWAQNALELGSELDLDQEQAEQEPDYIRRTRIAIQDLEEELLLGRISKKEHEVLAQQLTREAARMRIKARKKNKGV